MVERHADLIMQWVGMEQATNFEFTNFEFTNFDSPLISLMGQGSFHLSFFKNKFTNDARYLKNWNELQKITHLILSKTFIFQSYKSLLKINGISLNSSLPRNSKTATSGKLRQ